MTKASSIVRSILFFKAANSFSSIISQKKENEKHRKSNSWSLPVIVLRLLHTCHTWWSLTHTWRSSPSKKPRPNEMKWIQKGQKCVKTLVHSGPRQILDNCDFWQPRIEISDCAFHLSLLPHFYAFVINCQSKKPGVAENTCDRLYDVFKIRISYISARDVDYWLLNVDDKMENFYGRKLSFPLFLTSTLINSLKN